MPDDEPVDAGSRSWSSLATCGRSSAGRRKRSSRRLAKRLKAGDRLMIVLDRLTTGEASAERLRDSLEAAFAAGGGACVVLVEDAKPLPPTARRQYR